IRLRLAALLVLQPAPARARIVTPRFRHPHLLPITNYQLPFTNYLLPFALPHFHFPAAVVELDLVHQLVDEEDAASAGLQQVLGVERVRHLRAVEARARVANDDPD